MASIKCSKCNAEIKIDEQVYQLRMGYIAGNFEDSWDFCPEEEIEFYHVTCPKPYCNHMSGYKVPSIVETMQSPAYKLDIQEFDKDWSSEDYHIKFHWKETAFDERGLRIVATSKVDPTEEETYTYCYVKCRKCGVISSA